ncbi:15145_t:CDS:2 [Dentiscutata erythropus]|uniref:Homoserine kinase n=1 Tax=Dentiscutata erythropus TaxID=1348616 RepID=A0A9N9HDU4_9GLOM|nr:15145_t:CDS:2 [Dentiscutata erythropus]
MTYSRKLQITVPCSSSNIGPGFDVLGVTLSLYLTLDISIFEPASDKKNYNDEVVLAYSGEGKDGVPLSVEKNLITKTALYVLACNNISGFTAPMTINVNNPIPMGRGLGSSGAAVVAGVMLGNVSGHLGLTKDRMLDYCLMIEHHPDNVTAALMGGFVASYLRGLNTDDAGELKDEKNDAINKFSTQINYAELNLTLVYFQLIDHCKVFNLQRLAVLIMALSQSPPDADLICQAMQDKVHQPYRKQLIPGLSEIITNVKPTTYPGLLGICLSGAGPTILALATHNFDSISKAVIDMFAKKNIETVVKVLDVVEGGAQIVETY